MALSVIIFSCTSCLGVPGDKELCEQVKSSLAVFVCVHIRYKYAT